MILANRRVIREVTDDVTISFSASQTILTHVLRIKRSSKDCLKIAKFGSKITSHGHCSEADNRHQRLFRIAQKFHMR